MAHLSRAVHAARETMTWSHADTEVPLKRATPGRWRRLAYEAFPLWAWLTVSTAAAFALAAFF